MWYHLVLFRFSARQITQYFWHARSVQLRSTFTALAFSTCSIKSVQLNFALWSGFNRIFPLIALHEVVLPGVAFSGESSTFKRLLGVPSLFDGPVTQRWNSPFFPEKRAKVGVWQRVYNLIVFSPISAVSTMDHCQSLDWLHSRQSSLLHFRQLPCFVVMADFRTAWPKRGRYKVQAFLNLTTAFVLEHVWGSKSPRVLK